MWIVYDCTGERPLTRHRRLAQAGASYLNKQSRPIVIRVYLESPDGRVDYVHDWTRRAIEATSGSDTARRAARLPSRGLYGPGSATAAADIVATLGKK